MYWISINAPPYLALNYFSIKAHLRESYSGNSLFFCSNLTFWSIVFIFEQIKEQEQVLSVNGSPL